MDNILNARIKLKYDTYERWESIKNSFKPLAGEVILYQIPAQQTSTGLTPPTVGVKVGDGTNFLKDLPWIQAVAGDVYSWAKAENKPNYNATEISATRTDTIDGSTVESSPTVNAWLQSLTDDISSLSGGAGSISSQIANALAALDVTNSGSDPHNITGFSPAKTLATLIETDGYISATFQDILIAQSQVSGLADTLAAKAPLASPTFTGIVKVPAVTSASDDAVAATKKYVDDKTAGLSGAMHYKGAVAADPTVTTPTDTYESGDVVTNSNKEFIYDGTNWRELGDEGSYALKTTTVTGTNGLTGGGAISQNQTISHATKPATSTTPSSTVGSETARTYVKQVKLDAYGHVIDVTTGAETVVDNNTTYTFAQGDNDGEIKITATPNVNGTAGTATSVNVKPTNLKTVATTGSAYDLNEVNGTSTKYFILDCGSATVLIDAASNS